MATLLRPWRQESGAKSASKLNCETYFGCIQEPAFKTSKPFSYFRFHMEWLNGESSGAYVKTRGSGFPL